MIQALLESELWLDAGAWQREDGNQCDAVQCHVLLVTSTLTRFLERKYGLPLSVCLHEQFMDYVSETEAELLGIAVGDQCLRRKVSLMSRREVMFDAESVLPLDVLPMSLMAELEQGERPLANLLSDRGLRLSRSNLSVVKVQTEGFYHQLWARRSVLCAESGVKALVTEVFHDAVWRKIAYLMQR